jgi:hypothetical protein
LRIIGIAPQEEDKEMHPSVEVPRRRLYTLKEAGMLANRSTDTIKRWGSSGKFKLVWFMHARHVDIESFEEFIKGEALEAVG